MLAEDRGANVPVEIADGETSLGEAQVNVHHKTSLAEAPELAAKEENLELLDAQGRGSAHASGAHGNRFAEQRGGLAADPDFDENLGMSADKRRVIDSETGRIVPGLGESPEKNLTLEEEGNITARPKEQSLEDILNDQASSPEDGMNDRIDSSSELETEPQENEPGENEPEENEPEENETEENESEGDEPEENESEGNEPEENEPEENQPEESEDEDENSDPGKRIARKIRKSMDIEDNLSEEAKKLDRKPRKEPISDSYDKADLDPWLRKSGLDEDEIRDFGDWLKRKHAKGEPHDHLKPFSPKAKQTLQQWRDETGGGPEAGGGDPPSED
jgi:hypothetical protein